MKCPRCHEEMNAMAEKCPTCGWVNTLPENQKQKELKKDEAGQGCLGWFVLINVLFWFGLIFLVLL